MADPVKLAEHIKDADFFELPFKTPIPIPQPFEALGLHLTKFMVLELMAALLMLAIFIPVAWRIANGGPPRGTILPLSRGLANCKWRAASRTIALCVRDERVLPSTAKKVTLILVPSHKLPAADLDI